MTTIVAGFTTQGEPALGLSPTIRIRRTDTQALVVTDAAMTEQGDGMYSYDFAQDPTLKYAIRSDGTDVLPTVERYVFGSLGAIEDVDLATSAVNKIRDTILADSTPFNGANIDAAISSRGTADPGDAMDLIPNAVDAAAVATDAIDADALATDAVNEVR
ncbi:MAG: hypothetical protein GY906_10015, partial [bacterium]|nr:hypothetical protein [bacterium]